MEMKKAVTRGNWISLNKKDIKWLFIYYVILFMLSLITTSLIFWFYLLVD